MNVLRKDKIESRAYQEVIAASASDRNTLVVLPTGLGKTIIAVMVASIKLGDDSKILMLAPTKPLVEQHYETFKEFLDVPEDEMKVMTGEIRPEKRYELWEDSRVFFATPQVVENDLISAKVPVEDFSLTIFDEAHRATGEYSYVFINDKMRTQNLALTASPGGSKEKIMEVADNLEIENFEVRTEDDPDVEPYIQETDVNWLNVELDDRFEEARKNMASAKRNQLKELKRLGQLDSTSNVNKTDLLKLRGEISSKLSTKDDPKLYSAISRVATALKISQAIELLETQGVSQAYDYIQGLENDDSKAAGRVLNDDEMSKAINLINYLKKEGVEHPKTGKVLDIVSDLEEDSKALIFTEYRASVRDIVSKLQDEDVSAAKFVGQSGDSGMSQSEQIELLEEFEEGNHQVVVSTSIGEEGLDIPAVDCVIFYEPVPSSVRDIQRMGRTGRQESGEVYVLIAENTRDEGYYWSAHHKKKKMNKVLDELKNEVQERDQRTLENFNKKKSVKKKKNKIRETDDESKESSEASEEDKDQSFEGSELTVYTDDRENAVAKKLSRMDLIVRKQRLDVADFIVSDRTAIERKKAEDFVDSVIDSRLFEQVQELQQFQRPIIIIEGDGLYHHRDIHPNALRGAMATLAIDYGIPIIWSDDRKDTARILESLAKREQEEKDREIAIRGEKSGKNDKEVQEFFVAGLPGVNTKIAERILSHFGSIEKTVNASEEELKDVEGIGDKKASQIRDLITREYK